MLEGFIRSIELQRQEVPSFKTYPFVLPAVRNLSTLRLHPKVTFLVGENGTGKSTLLEAIAVKWGLNAEGGSKNQRFATRTSHSDLADFLRLAKTGLQPDDAFFLRAESFYNFATEIEREGKSHMRYYGGRSPHEQSHGEAFFNLMMNRFFGGGLYLLDEPEAALSPMRQMAMMSRMKQLTRTGSQFIIATHSPILMAYPDADVLYFDEDGIRPTRYDQTEHWFVTQQFLAHPDRMLRTLLSDGDESES